MVKKTYVPEKGDIVWLTFSPTEGHEQAGRRPALILSPKAYNSLTGLALVVPITTRIKGFGFEVAISVLNEPSVVLSDHVKSLAFTERHAEYICTATLNVLDEVLAKIRALLD
jgi:mRNA interferase MazF